MVVPATLAATIGLDQLRAWLARVLPDRLIEVAVAAGLTASTLAMTRDALVNGPRWFPDYGMQGQQWGAKELFAELGRRLATAPPGSTFVISHLWANNANAFEDFFLQPEDRERITWGVIDDVLHESRAEVKPTTVFVLTPPEYARALASPKLRIYPGTTIIDDPSGQPGFYLVKLAYTEAADSIFAAEALARKRLVDDTVTIDGVQARIRHPLLDMGTISEAFDGNERSLARTLDANPTTIEIRFPTARPVSGVLLHLWTEHYRIRLRAFGADGSEIADVVRDAVSGLPPEPIEVLFDERVSDVAELKLSIVKEGDVHVHLREIEILE